MDPEAGSPRNLCESFLENREFLLGIFLESCGEEGPRLVPGEGILRKPQGISSKVLGLGNPAKLGEISQKAWKKFL